STAVPKSKLPVMLPSKAPPHVQLDPALLQGIEERLARDFPAIADKPLVLVYPGGGILPIRAWPLASYTALCNGLVADGCAVAVIGLKDDQALARELVAQVQGGGSLATDRGNSPFKQGLQDWLGQTAGAAAPSGGRELREAGDREGDIIDLTGYTRSVAELLALFHKASLLVTNDGPRCYSFYSQWPCSPCLTAYNHRSSFCDGDNQCLKVIAPEAVLAKARECLASA
ncbi:MAG: hypothetical protein B7Y42_16080, partial [Polaromonas sp. 28-63-22]